MSSNSLNGKAALVTGGSRGIGAAIARRLAADGTSSSEHQARMVGGEIEATGGHAIAIKADNRHATAIERAVADAVRAFGRLDILVNSAGIWRAAPIDTLSLADFDGTMEVNLRAPFVASKAAAAHMGEGGRIISIGSNLAERVTDTSLSAYSTSKAALVGLTKALARDLGSRGITANVVHPGSTDTDMNPATGPHAEHQRQKMATPRFGKAEEIAGMVAWLAGPEGRFVTGAALTIDGGANA
ncbi:SDR family oxidoreductase [Mesorhizobium sp. M00.F.Ca.ET.216.01.1.1]|uniref:SDR family oxidoreductase n=1 Tax=Mesorhizobium sp. M00.F.Ca.ET.216.01.1.1 TaxID=2500528 RepID=UPI000FDC257E|nr:SDR family oxidoreductase [Mesorhizobium sp. M00.F.Ca.ET.216.01.1.1]TGQ47779.1 SDR family oxidoreductase [Mesorhizobium sp. M00.F.Ca.ET.216.01.1.1]